MSRALAIPQLKKRAYTMTAGDLLPVENCTAACVYVAHPKPEAYHVWTGIFVHRFIEYAQREGVKYAEGWLRTKTGTAGLRAQAIVAKLDVESLPRGEAEVELVLDARDGKVNTGTYRDAHHDRHVYMRLDLAYEEDGRTSGLDWKTGDREYDVAREPQFQLGALALWLLNDTPVAVNFHAVVLAQDCEPRWCSHTFVRAELEQIQRRVRMAHGKMRMARLEILKDKRLDQIEYTPGAHCQTCRAKPACPHAWKPEDVVEDIKRAFDPKPRIDWAAAPFRGGFIQTQPLWRYGGPKIGGGR